MKKSNYNRLTEKYVCQTTSRKETLKIESMLEAIAEREIHFIAEEAEELLFQKIKDNKVQANEITLLVRGLCKLRVSEVQWMRFKGMDVYFAKEAYIS